MCLSNSSPQCSSCESLQSLWVLASPLSLFLLLAQLPQLDVAPYTCSHTSGCAFPARAWAFCSEFRKIYFLSSARLPCWRDLRVLEISHPLFYNFIQPSKAVRCSNSPCGWSSQPLISDVTQSRVDSPLNLTPGEPVCALLSSSWNTKVEASSPASPGALQMMRGPARARGAVPVVPHPLCWNTGCIHLPVPWGLLLRCSRIISWPVSKHFIYPSRGSCARALEGIHQHWCAVYTQV